MKQRFLLFVPERVEGYSFKDAPVMVPVVLNGKTIASAFYQDFVYGFVLPERIEQMLEEGLIKTQFVYSHDLAGESYQPREGARLVRIQIDGNKPAPKPTFDDPDNILEL